MAKHSATKMSEKSYTVGLRIATLDHASEAEMRNYCRDVMGIDPKDIAPNVLKGKIRAFMASHGDTGKDSAEPIDLTIMKMSKDDFLNADTVVIILAPDNNETGAAANRPLPVGFNGVNYLVPRNVPVRVPRGVVEILNNAIATRVDPETKNEYEQQLHQYKVVS